MGYGTARRVGIGEFSKPGQGYKLLINFYTFYFKNIYLARVGI